MRTWEIVRVALEGIRRTPLRIALTAAGVALATGALLSMIAFAEGVRSQAERPFDELDLFNRIDVWADDEAGGRRHRDQRPPEEEKTASATTDEDAPKTLDDAGARASARARAWDASAADSRPSRQATTPPPSPPSASCTSSMR